MQDFTLYIEDDRYRVATLRIVSARDAAMARKLALNCLGETSHHLAVEVCEEGRLLFKLTRDQPHDSDRSLAC
jgi:hypothetical protein